VKLKGLKDSAEATARDIRRQDDAGCHAELAENSLILAQVRRLSLRRTARLENLHSSHN
jgi:hypothetical protein